MTLYTSSRTASVVSQVDGSPVDSSSQIPSSQSLLSGTPGDCTHLDAFSLGDAGEQFPRQLFLAWVPFQRRAVTMQSYFGYDLHHISLSFKCKALRPLEYVIKAWQSLWLMVTLRPQVLWVQMPPAPLLYLVFAYRLLWSRRVRLVADCHNATFRTPWINFPGVVALLNRCDLVLVHNEDIAQQAKDLGVKAERMQVLLDRVQPLPAGQGFEELAARLRLTAPWFLVPCSFNSDEPIAEILAAARQAPDLTFVLTGNPARAQGRHDLSQVPSNVKLPGFLPEEQFNALFYEANAVVGLTKLDGIQLSVANEALGCGRPMVLANQSLLRRLFPAGAVYVDPLDAADLVAGCRKVLAQSDRLTQATLALKADRAEQWFAAAAPIRQRLVESISHGCQ